MPKLKRIIIRLWRGHKNYQNAFKNVPDFIIRGTNRNFFEFDHNIHVIIMTGIRKLIIFFPYKRLFVYRIIKLWYLVLMVL